MTAPLVSSDVYGTDNSVRVLTMNRPEARRLPIMASPNKPGRPGARALDLGARYDEVPECDGRQIRAQRAEFLEFLVGPALHQQRNEIAYPAASEPRVRVLDYGGDVTVRKICVFLSEALLHFANQYPLFLRHPNIVALTPTTGQDAWCKRFVV